MKITDKYWHREYGYDYRKYADDLEKQNADLKEELSKALSTFNNIVEKAKRTTSANVTHSCNNIAGLASNRAYLIKATLAGDR